MPYPVVLFDLDHTLMDSDVSLRRAYDVTMTSVGVADPDSVYALFDEINQALWRQVEAHEVSPNEVRVLRFARLIEELGLDAQSEQMAETFVDGLIAHGDLYDGARELLDDLGARCRLALVTNGIGRVQRGRLERLGLERDFEVVSISGELGVSKPGREIFDVTLDAMGVSDRTGVVMIGDNPGSDIRGGVAAEIATIWFNPAGAASPDDVVATHEVAALHEIRTLV